MNASSTSNQTTNFGHEGTKVEFKSSFCFTANTKKPDQAYNVFKAVCAMANTEGGIIYIGVNDSGEVAIGKNYGVKGDMAHMHLKSVDAYARTIAGKLGFYFQEKDRIHDLVTVEETDNENVVAITVKKSTKRVVRIHQGKDQEYIAYRREGASSRVMDGRAIKNREAELARMINEDNKKYKDEKCRLAIERAIEEKKKVILRKYSSSNSRTVKDRTVEPIGLILDGRSVWAYEEESTTAPLKQFRIDRINGGVSVINESWQYEDQHVLPIIDGFEWARTTEPKYNVCMLLNVSAKNNLIEKTPEGGKYLTDSGDDQWLFCGAVHSLESVAHFCEENRNGVVVYSPEDLAKQSARITGTAPEAANTNEAIIRRAILEKKKVVLHNYASLRSGTYKDRIVEPIEFICDGRSIWTYEAASEGCNPLRQFRLSRINGAVEILDEPWEHEDAHKPAFVDSFEWARSTKPMLHIKIMLNGKAWLRLLEATPEAAKFITRKSNGTWELDAAVHSIEPVQEFCRLNIDDIEVIAPRELMRRLGIRPRRWSWPWQTPKRKLAQAI